MRSYFGRIKFRSHEQFCLRPTFLCAGQDITALENVTAYLNDHYAFEIPLERFSQIAAMGTTKLKTTSKQFHNCAVTEYILQRRMSQAEHLLAKTDLTIGQVAQAVGYSTSSRFAELFRKITGILAERIPENRPAGIN